jgi:hypothetical protein
LFESVPEGLTKDTISLTSPSTGLSGIKFSTHAVYGWKALKDNNEMIFTVAAQHLIAGAVN